MNINTPCVVINQCGKEDCEEYKKFKIYSYNELGAPKSRNMALDKANGDILLLCDDRVIDKIEKRYILCKSYFF